MIKFRCEHCRHQYDADGNEAGDLFRCEECGRRIQVPEGSESFFKRVFGFRKRSHTRFGMSDLATGHTGNEFIQQVFGSSQSLMISCPQCGKRLPKTGTHVIEGIEYYCFTCPNMSCRGPSDMIGAEYLVDAKDHYIYTYAEAGARTV